MVKKETKEETPKHIVERSIFSTVLGYIVFVVITGVAIYLYFFFEKQEIVSIKRDVENTHDMPKDNSYSDSDYFDYSDDDNYDDDDFSIDDDISIDDDDPDDPDIDVNYSH